MNAKEMATNRIIAHERLQSCVKEVSIPGKDYVVTHRLTTITLCLRAWVSKMLHETIDNIDETKLHSTTLNHI